MATKKDVLSSNKVFLYLAIGTLAVLFVPMIAMQFKSDVVWGREDFIAIGTLLFGAGSMFVLVARALPNKYRTLSAVATVGLVLWIWVELAVGLFTNIGS